MRMMTRIGKFSENQKGKKKMGEGGAFLYRKAGLLQGYYGGPAAKRESIGKGITFPDGKRGQDHPLRAA